MAQATFCYVAQQPLSFPSIYNNYNNYNNNSTIINNNNNNNNKNKNNTKKWAFIVGRRGIPLRALLAFSASLALAFAHRRQEVNARAIMNLSTSIGTDTSAINSKMKVIDSHLHVWAPPHQIDRFPYFPGQEPTLPGSVEDLLQVMEESNVHGAMIVQPINHMFDHSYVSSVLKKYPSKFIGCCLADPTEGGGGVGELERLVLQEGFSAVRFNPYLWPSGQKMTNSVGKKMFLKAGQLGIPVGFMCFKGLHLHLLEIEELCTEYPETTVLIDHFGFCKPATNVAEKEIWSQLLNLSRFPKVYVKVSAFFRVSREKFPYEDLVPLLMQLLDAYGSRRLLWGSDFPFVMNECGYQKAANTFLQLSKAGLSFSKEDLAMIMGGSTMELFKGSWLKN